MRTHSYRMLTSASLFALGAGVAANATLGPLVPGALKPAYALTGFFTCQIGAVAGMMAVMLARADPSASAVMLAVLLALTAGSAALTVALYRTFTLGSQVTRRSELPWRAAVPPLTGRE